MNLIWELLDIIVIRESLIRGLSIGNLCGGWSSCEIECVNEDSYLGVSLLIRV